jgi:glycosyltransferase involved in cell wall biosynthesis
VSVSVLICSRNPRLDYLDRVLASLRRQTLSQSSWELVLVDNGSDLPLSTRVDLSWHRQSRHVHEPVEGLTGARFRAIDESRCELLVFVDDDNVLAEDYLEAALTIRNRFSDVRVFGAGCIEGQFEVEPPVAIRRHLPMLAIRTISESRVSANPVDGSAIPWGAGLCVDRAIAVLYRPFADELGIRSVLGRQNGRLYQGDDDLFSWIGATNGARFGIFAELKLTHLIAASRLTRRYILQLLHDHALSSHVRDYVLSGGRPRRIGIGSMARLGAHGFRRGWFSMQCQWAETRGADRAARLLASLGTQPAARSPRLGGSFVSQER